MDERDIKNLLDQLADTKAAVDAVNLKKQDAIKAVLTPEIKAQLDDIEIEFSGQAQAAVENAAKLEAEIKAAVVKYGVSVKGEYLQGVYNKGRSSFDTARTKAYLKAQGILDDYYTQGEPYASIRKV